MQLWASKARRFAAAARRNHDLVPAVIAVAAVAALSQAEGGYFPKSWGVAALALFWVIAIALVVEREVLLARVDAIFLGALGGLVAWTAISSVWSASGPQTIHDVERTLVYVGATAAVLVTARRRSAAAVAGGVLAGIVLVSTYGVAKRLLPEVFGPREARHVDAAALFEPLGYSNAVGSVAALGAMLALAFATRADGRAARAAGAASFVVLTTTLYLSLSRGAWLGLGVGIVSALVVDPRRLHLLAVLASLSPFAFAAVAVAWRSPALVARDPPAAAVEAQGYRLAVVLVLCALTAAAAAVGLYYAERRIAVGPRGRRLAAILLAAAATALLAVVFVRAGSPPALAARAYTEFTTPPDPGQTQQQQLLSVSSGRRTVYWSAAWEAVKDAPVLGIGAGAFAQYWRQHRDSRLNVLDAHSLYVETLAELGPIGLGLLLVVLGTPIVAAWHARAHPLVPLLLGGYVVYLVHAGVDWLWEMAAVTVTALLCGAALTLAARRAERGYRPRIRSRVPALAAVAVAAVFSFVALIGNSATEAAERALATGKLESAKREARTAAQWTPWASDPWRLLGEAQLLDGDTAAARASFREAIVRDSRNWILWYDLGLASEGDGRRAAFARAYALNPLDVRRLGAARE